MALYKSEISIPPPRGERGVKNISSSRIQNKFRQRIELDDMRNEKIGPLLLESIQDINMRSALVRHEPILSIEEMIGSLQLEVVAAHMPQVHLREIDFDIISKYMNRQTDRRRQK